MSKTYACGNCGKLGHNSQTCGKNTPTLFQKHPSLLPQPSSFSSLNKTHSPVTEQMILKATEATPPLTRNTTPTFSEDDTLEDMTGDDLATWWMLQAGQTTMSVSGWKDFINSLPQLVRTPKNISNLTRTLIEKNYMGEDILEKIARQPECSVEELVAFSTYPSEKVRAGVARNENTPAGVLKKLAEDDSMEVRMALLKNFATPENLVAYSMGNPHNKLSEGEQREFLSEVATDASVPTTVVERVLIEARKTHLSDIVETAVWQLERRHREFRREMRRMDYEQNMW